MTCQEYEVHIDDYVDDSIDEALRASCEAHLSSCARCRALTTDFQTIRSVTRTLEPQVPSPQVWYRLAAAIEAEPRGLSTAWLGGWQRAAASAVMCALVVAGLSWIGARLTPVAREQERLTASLVNREPGAIDAEDFSLVEQQYTSAIAGLEDITRKERASLDMNTAEVLQANLTVIDGAIGDSRAALDREPESGVAQESLVGALQSKMALLQDTVTLINALREADEGSAGRGTGLNQ
jgi:hypothetical protein